MKLRSLAPLALVLLAAACGKKEAPAPPPTTLPPSTMAAPTTTTTTTTTLPAPPAAWKTARWGMSKAELLKAFPGQAQRLTPPGDFGAPAPGPADVAIPALEEGGLTFRVLFGFPADRLGRIQLVAAKPGAAACGDVEKAVTDAHAGLAPQRDSAQTNIRTDTASWKAPEAAITLTCTEARGLGYRTVTLEYAPPAP